MVLATVQVQMHTTSGRMGRFSDIGTAHVSTTWFYTGSIRCYGSGETYGKFLDWMLCDNLEYTNDTEMWLVWERAHEREEFGVFTQ